jgi:Protein of unknown function (DUF3572)
MPKAPRPPGSLAKSRRDVPFGSAASSGSGGLAGGKAISREAAEALALQGLTFLAGDATRLTQFLTATGVDPGNLSDWNGNPGIQAAVLDFLLSDESLLLVFAAEAGVRPEEVWPAQTVLAGG